MKKKPQELKNLEQQYFVHLGDTYRHLYRTKNAFEDNSENNMHHTHAQLNNVCLSFQIPPR